MYCLYAHVQLYPWYIQFITLKSFLFSFSVLEPVESVLEDLRALTVAIFDDEEEGEESRLEESSDVPSAQVTSDRSDSWFGNIFISKNLKKHLMASDLFYAVFFFFGNKYFEIYHIKE